MRTNDASQKYDEGQKVILTLECRDNLGAVYTPTAISVKVKPPAGTVVTSTPTNTGPGLYEHGVVGSMPGTWYYRWEVTAGGNANVMEGRFIIKDSVFL